MVNCKDYLDQNFPLENRWQVEILKLRKKNLAGHLDLSGFTNLKELDCSFNEITSLDLSKNVSLERILVQINKIKANLSVFSHLVNLKEIVFETIQGSGTNHFYGSFEALKDLVNLEEFFIGDGVYDESYVIDQSAGFKKPVLGLEYLPHKKLTKFSYSSSSYYSVILDPFNGDLGVWKLINHPEVITNDNNELLKNIEEAIKEVQRDLWTASFRVGSRSVARIENKLEMLKTKKKSVERFMNKIKGLETEVETHLKALDVAEEWHKKQKAEIIEEEKQKSKKLEDRIKSLERQIFELTLNNEAKILVNE